MFLTNSIRRKMVIGLGLVVVMLGALLASGLWGLASLRAIIHDDSLNAPAAAEVITAIAKIRATIPAAGHPQSRTEPVPVLDPQALHGAVLEARSLIASYRSRLDSPGVRLQKAAAWNLLAFLERRLTKVQGAVELQQPLPAGPLRIELDRLLATASELPELPGIQSRLNEAREDYQTALAVVWISSVFVFLGLLGLVIFGIRCVFRPVNALHQGARRVAQGDFSFRVTIDSDDEVGELAESFNCMAGRFEEIASSLEREVEERSRQLVRSDRLASVGFLAAGVAHEVNNPLTAIQWSAESLESRLAELLHNVSDTEAVVVRQYVTMIQAEAERCQAITRKLLDFSRNHDSQKTRQDVVGIIREVISLITHMKKFREARIELTAPDQCRIEINGHEVKQVLLNLVANALDSTQGQGAVFIELFEQIDWVGIQIRDNGCGLTADTMENLFQPFFTTKETGRGTGLGLSISDRIVADHGGRISVSSDGPDCGSTFTVRLPRLQKPSADATGSPTLTPAEV